MENATPVSNKNRIHSLDVLRGLAILCILIMNIPIFSSLNSTVPNPLSYGEFTGADKWIWILSHIFADQKFMAIFSTLFGAGIFLMAESNKKKGIKESSIHFRRMLWLMLFGLLHAYLLWEGDILFSYALIGMVMFLLRNKSPKKLIIIASILFIIPVLLNVLNGLAFQFVEIPESEYKDQLQYWSPTQEEIAADIAAYQGSWMEQMPFRAKTAFFLQVLGLLFYTFWRTGALMLLGMALMKTGFLKAEKENSVYVKTAIVGFLVGISINILGVIFNINQNFSFEVSGTMGSAFNYIAGLFTMLGFISVVMLITKSQNFMWLKSILTSVGKMAFTNYIMQSVICTFIFYGHGLGYYGTFNRTEQMITVVSVWVFQIIFSKFWLTKFKYGPLEWLWRSLTYKKAQPFKLS